MSLINVVRITDYSFLFNHEVIKIAINCESDYEILKQNPWQNTKPNSTSLKLRPTTYATNDHDGEVDHACMHVLRTVLKHLSNWHGLPFGKMYISETCFRLALCKLRHIKAAC